jgi:hypothetical protein
MNQSAQKTSWIIAAPRTSMLPGSVSSRLRGHRVKDGRRALCVRKSRPVAQSEVPQPAGIRGGRLDRSGRIATASRRAFARLLHGRRQAHLCWPRRHRHVREGAQGSAPASRAVEAGEVALERAAARSTRFGSPLVLSHVHWVDPKLVVETTFLTWTADNLLRQTVYVGLREDKPAEQVRREQKG